jgi:hypothetical protein
LSSEDEFCGASNDISDDESCKSFNELAHHHQEKKKAFLELNLPFQRETWWILVTFATNRLKKHYACVIVYTSKGEPIVKFKRRVKNCSVFV